jgi:hypothetical protein
LALPFLNFCNETKWDSTASFSTTGRLHPSFGEAPNFHGTKRFMSIHANRFRYFGRNS